MRTNYVELIKQKVEIPIIQRDFAQGRMDEKSKRVRKDFLDVLFDTIQKKSSNDETIIELDFIYGFVENVQNQNTKFVPIDGQQRLTVLWLLYWLVASKEKVEPSDITFMSNFIYETRHSTTEFCRELVRFEPTFTSDNITLEIKNQSWYFETWDYDPSIQSMLVMLDDLEDRYNLLENNNVWSLISKESCPFYFYKLDMMHVGLTDDLYIKMNSRGKALTEFEYFKANFAELIKDLDQRERFTQSIDGIWADSFWQYIYYSGNINLNDDIALLVDNAFLNLFNFITSVIVYKSETDFNERYQDTIKSSKLLSEVYSNKENLSVLFEILDSICRNYREQPLFWSDTFYVGKENFQKNKTRLYFQHSEIDLLNRCLFYYSRGFSYPEQLLLWACLTQFRHNQSDFSYRIRKARNLTINSDSELRDSTLGRSFSEIESYIQSGDLSVLKTFKTDQIEEEKTKNEYLKLFGDKDLIHRAEDSDLFRGSISLFPLDIDFSKRCSKFLEIFEEDQFVNEFDEKSKLLLCFGDYSQLDGTISNLMAANKSRIRGFITTPGYNKSHFNEKTRSVFLRCLDFFIEYKNITPVQKIFLTLDEMERSSKDWRYYFLKYDSFREDSHYGYHQFWNGEQYCIWKMGRKQFNGYHWDPFFHEIIKRKSVNVSLNSYGGKLEFSLSGQIIRILSLPNGFHFQIENSELLKKLKLVGILNNLSQLTIEQDITKTDKEDRIDRLENVLLNLLNDLN